MNARRAHAAALAVVASIPACGRTPPPPPPEGAPTASVVPALEVGIHAPDASPDAASDGEARASAPEYPREGIRALASACKDPQAVLGRAQYGNTTLLVRIKQAMLAHPEFRIVAGKPVAPEQITLVQTSYGGKIFSIKTSGFPGDYAVIARCADPAACLDLAAMVRATVPGVTPTLFCGDPPAISGQKEPLAGPWTIPDGLPGERDRTAVCARIVACSVRVAAAARDAAMAGCTKAPLAGAARCAARIGCDEVARCARAAP